MTQVVKEILGNNQVEINKEKALEYLGNDFELYNQFINLYFDNYNNLDLILTKHLNNKNYHEIINIVHKIKGVAIYTGCDLYHQYVLYLHQKYKMNNFINVNIEIDLLILFNKKLINLLMIRE